MEKSITVTRVYDAPVKDAWRLWTEPELVKRWWGPDKFICPFAEIDFRVGGFSLVAMKAPKEMGGKEWFSAWTYKEILPMKRIEFIQNLADEKGNRISPVAAGMPADFPEDIRTIVTFNELANNKTEMTVTEFADFGQTTKFAIMGLEQSMDKMTTVF